MAHLSHLNDIVSRPPPYTQIAQTPTPLHQLERVSSELNGPRIWIKRDDLTGSGLSGNKVRKLEFVIAQAIADGCDTLITCGGVQSNHCRATALAAARLGLKVKLVLRNDLGDKLNADGNLFLDFLAGAEVNIFSPREYRKRLDQLLIDQKTLTDEAGGKGFIIPTGASDEIGIWGYINASYELQKNCESFGFEPASIVVATGSGGTQAGLTAGIHLCGMETEVLGIAVCDDERYFKRKVSSDIKKWQQRYNIQKAIPAEKIRVNDHYIGPGYAKAEKEVFDTISWLAQNEGIVLDPVYTGKAFHGLVKEIQRGSFRKGDDIVFVHTGGIFGLMAQRHSFGFEHKAL
ncbi:D-cysteine desulfhydrase family protein [Aurantivibrio plasticivorans]